MGFASILWPGEPGETADERPPFFPDLSLDQVVEGILAGRAEYDLIPTLVTGLTRPPPAPVTKGSNPGSAYLR